MTWIKIASRRETIVFNMRSIVTGTVAAYRRRGMKMAHAREAAARTLGITARRVRSYQADEVASVSAEEALGLADAWRRSQAAKVEALEAEIAAERRNLEQLDARCRDVTAALSGAAVIAR